MRLRIASCPFPFRGSFEHASAVRERAENVIAIAEDDAGLVGLGEGCPRFYVTGETVTSAMAAITRWRAAGIEDKNRPSADEHCILAGRMCSRRFSPGTS